VLTWICTSLEAGVVQGSARTCLPHSSLYAHCSGSECTPGLCHPHAVPSTRMCAVHTRALTVAGAEHMHVCVGQGDGMP
jgi:hypothetical protein